MKKKRFFIKNGDPHGTVVLNWQGSPEEEFTFYAEAYRLVAKEAVEHLRSIPHFGLYGDPIYDFRAYPIVFLYRHALELYMKAVIFAAAPMLKLKDFGEIDRDKLLKPRNVKDTLTYCKLTPYGDNLMAKLRSILYLESCRNSDLFKGSRQ